jgi:signal peptidase I
MAEPSKPRSQDTFGGRIRFLIILVLGAWLLRSLIVAPFSIPSGSMLPTMAVGDYLFVAKWPYGYSRYSFPFHFPAFGGRILGRLPERGDIVVFQRPSTGSSASSACLAIRLPSTMAASSSMAARSGGKAKA